MKNLCEFVSERFDNYQANGRLNYQQVIISENEVWLTLGGDHGGGSFKFTVQVLNTESSNTKTNIIVIYTFTAEDLQGNLQSVLSLYATQVEQQCNMKWNRKECRVFLCGDYAFLASTYDLSGARVVHVSLLCLIDSITMQISRHEQGRAHERTLHDNHAYHEAFKSERS